MMSDQTRKTTPQADDKSSCDRRLLTDAFHRQGPQPGTAGRSLVLIFEDMAYQFPYFRGDSQADIAARLREFADRLDQ